MKKYNYWLSLFLVLATVYHPLFDGKRTASGDKYNHWKGLTCASNVYPFGTRLIVHYKDMSVQLIVNDRLSKKFKDRRVDLSGKAMYVLTGSWQPTSITVEVEAFYPPKVLKKK